MLIINIGWIVHFIAETNLHNFSLTWGEKSDHEKHFSLSSAWFAVGLSIFCQDRWIIGNAGMQHACKTSAHAQGLYFQIGGCECELHNKNACFWAKIEIY